MALLTLDDSDALDPTRVGAKAAALATARRRGCPVLAGFVVPARCLADEIATAEVAAATEGVHAAQLALSLTPLPDDLEEEIVAAGRALGADLVCRSSSMAEVDPRWAGAFSSFVGVSAEELPIAVRGCISSAFRPDVVERLQDDERLATIVPSALVQPLLRARCSGTAHLDEEGAVLLQVVEGSPAPLLSGRADASWGRVERDLSSTGPAVDLAGAPTLREVARLVAMLGGVPGTTLEWAADDGPSGVVLLQVGHTAPRRPTRAPRHRPRMPLAPDTTAIAAHTARVAADYAGLVGEALFLPWAFAEPRPPVAVSRAERSISPGEALQRAEALAAELNAATVPRGVAPAELVEHLAGRCSDEDLRLVLGLRTPDPLLVAEFDACIEVIGSTLRSLGLKGSPAIPWRSDLSALRRLLAGGHLGEAAAEPPPGRWQRLFQLALESSGTSYVVEGAAEGIVAGVTCRAAPETVAAMVPAGAIVVVDQPLARHAPLLWRSGGLVSCSGSEGAHLFEVARARRIPAVIVRAGAATPELADGALVLVDGDAEELLVLDHARPSLVP